MEHDERNFLRLFHKLGDISAKALRGLVHSADDVSAYEVVVPHIHDDIVLLGDFVVGLDDLGQFLDRGSVRASQSMRT